MNNYTIHSQETAPADSTGLLDTVEKTYGFVPNLLGVMAESPAVLKSYLTLGKLFDQSSFNAVERQVLLLAISRYNECLYCVAAHTVAAGMQNVPAGVIDAIRSDEPIEDERLQSLREFATRAVDKRGWLSEMDLAKFQNAGFSKAQVLEVILAASYKTLSNYINHVADTPLDDAFASQAWVPPQ